MLSVLNGDVVPKYLDLKEHRRGSVYLFTRLSVPISSRVGTQIGRSKSGLPNGRKTAVTMKLKLLGSFGSLPTVRRIEALICFELKMGEGSCMGS